MEKVISKDGTEIAYDRTGKGPALVLVDGAFCYRKHGVTSSLAPLLSPCFTVYSYDRRGRGDSTDAGSYSVERELEDLEAIVSATGESSFLYGISSGASLTLLAAAKGLKVKKIALFEPPYVAKTPAEIAGFLKAKNKLKSLVEKGDRSGAVKYFMTSLMGMPGIVVLLFKFMGGASWKNNEGVAHTLSYDVDIMGDGSVPGELISGIKCPVLVIGGDRSTENLKQAVRLVGEKIKGSEIQWLEGQKHNAPSKVVAPVLIRYFNNGSIPSPSDPERINSV